MFGCKVDELPEGAGRGAARCGINCGWTLGVFNIVLLSLVTLGTIGLAGLSPVDALSFISSSKKTV